MSQHKRLKIKIMTIQVVKKIKYKVKNKSNLFLKIVK